MEVVHRLVRLDLVYSEMLYFYLNIYTYTLGYKILYLYKYIDVLKIALSILISLTFVPGDHFVVLVARP